MDNLAEAAEKLGLRITNQKTERNKLVKLSENLISQDLESIIITFNNGFTPVYNHAEQNLSLQNRAIDEFPLSDIQYAFIIGRTSSIELGGIPSCMYQEKYLNNIDIAKLESSLRQLIQLHPMLRAAVHNNQSQRIHNNLPDISVELIPIEDLTEIEQSLSLQKTRYEMENQVLSLEHPPLIQAKVSKLTAQKVCLHLYFDLTMIDFRSIQILLRDWHQLYQHSRLVPINRANFSHYIEEENTIKNSVKYHQDKIFWLEKLSQIGQSPELPISQAAEQIRQPAFYRKTKNLSNQLIERLSKVCAKKGITLEVLFLGLYIEVIRQWSKNQNFTITCSQFNRRNAIDGIENTVGNFLSPLLITTNAQAETLLIDRLIQLQSELLLNRWHSSFNGIEVIRELNKNSDSNRTIAFPIVFSNTLDANLKKIIDDYEWPEEFASTVSHKTPQVWIENQLLSINNQTCIHWNFINGLFPDEMIEQMFDSYIQLIHQCGLNDNIFEQHNQFINLPLSDQIEQQYANATSQYIKPQLLQNLIKSASIKYPNATAIVQGNESITYNALVDRANQLAKRILTEVSIIPGDIIAVSFTPGIDLIVSILGVLSAGAAYVSIDPSHPLERKDTILQQCEAKALLVNQPQDNALYNNQFPIINIQHPVTLDRVDEVILPIQHQDDLAYVIFTSGSTGKPKGVMVSHQNAANTILDINQKFSVNANDAVLSLVPSGFDLCVYDYFGLLSVGGKLVFPDPATKNEPYGWLSELVRHKITIWNTVPAPIKAMVDTCEQAIAESQLRLVLLSGDWIPVDLPERIKSYLPQTQVISLGGATEGSIWSIYYPIESVSTEWKSIPYGKPLANQRFYVLNEWLSNCPKWVIGELYIGGDGVAKGYINDPAKTAERFIYHPVTNEYLYRTGDLGRYIEDGYIEILGREDGQVKINGYRVELGEIESTLLKTDSVNHVVIHAPIHPHTKQRHIVAYYVAKDSNASEEAIAERLKQFSTEFLPSYMVPTYFVAMPTIPLTNNGKIDHKSFPSPWTLNQDNSGGQQPGNPVEEKLLALWQAQLKHTDINIHQGFFDVGGDSLHAVSILGSIRTEFDIPSSAEQEIIEGLFINANIREFAQIIMRLKPDYADLTTQASQLEQTPDTEFA
ncbi:non-ribosomal peptide synthetase [Aliikangiella maris]|uniref:Amino acid adenylation domain-containing protein n=2 Tax=Aliikangiella maris TaxID=3162458 RepID=A0ABV3MS92_9GAMM